MGLLLVSVVMLRGVFPRWVAWLGVVTGVLGIAAEALRMVVEGFYVVYGILLPVWMAAVGWQALPARPSEGGQDLICSRQAGRLGA